MDIFFTQNTQGQVKNLRTPIFLCNSRRAFKLQSELAEYAKRHMAVGQLKGFAPRTYGVTDGTVATTSPDSSGSPQRCDVVAAS
jgi:hypothetical protein